MATSLMPEISQPNVAQDTILNAKGVPAQGFRIRQQCEVLRAQMEAEKATFMSQWRELADFIKPRRARFAITDVNKGDRRWFKIIDSTGTKAATTCQAGMMAGITNPSNPWFRLTVPDPELAEQDDVKEWLHEVQVRMETVFLRSNLYQVLPTLYGDIAVFGSGAMAVMEDDKTVIRCYDFPVGQFAFANDGRLQVQTFLRTFRLTVQQVVDRWGEVQNGQPNFMDGRPTTLSMTVQNLWRNNARQTWIDLVHVIRPNEAHDPNKIDAKYKKFEDIYYEFGYPHQPGAADDKIGLLAHSGFDEFPVLCARWDVNSEDVYGTDCPGMRALGDIKQLQTMKKRGAQGIEKMLNPPLTGPARLQNTTVSTLPGGMTYDDVREQQAGLRPIYEVKFDLNPVIAEVQDLRERINGAFYADLFLMMAQSDRREITAREIDERHEEKLLVLGPTLFRVSEDVSDPLIDRTFNIMQRKGLLPPPPDSLAGLALQVEYISIFAQAQKQIALVAMERFASFMGQAAQYDPSVLDMVNSDELIQQYADATGIPPKILRSMDVVQQLRDQRAKQQQLQQTAENAPGVASAVKDLSQAPIGGNNALAALLGKTNARNTLSATQQPPPRLVA
jgi:hypothetical protein